MYGECILRDTRDVILYDDLRFYLRKKYKTDHITEDEINRVIARLETSDGGGVYAENVEALRLLQEGFSLKRTNPKLPNLHIYPIDYTEVDNNELGKNNIFKFVNQLVIDGEHHREHSIKSTIKNRIRSFHLMPSVKELIWCKK